MITSTEKTCKTCRYAKTDKRPRVLDATGFGDQLMFASEEDGEPDEVVYACNAFAGAYSITMIGDDGKTGTTSVHPMPVDQSGNPVRMPLCEHAGKTIGTVPITCAAWTAPVVQDERLAEIDRMIAAREARIIAKGK